MVLQQAPNQANIWGYTSDCEDKVSINFNNVDYPATIVKGAGETIITCNNCRILLRELILLLTVGGNGMCKWITTLPATKADSQTTYTITAKSQKYGSINISDVLFGDVWVCSGQSNMQFALPQV